MLFDGVDRVRPCRAQSVVAPSRDGDIRAGNRVRVRARRSECASAHDYVAGHC